MAVDPIFIRWRASKLHDAVVSVLKPNYSGEGSLVHYDWNKPRTNSQPNRPPLHMPLYNILYPLIWNDRQIPEGQLGAYLVPVKTYGSPMDFSTAGVASLKG